MDDPNGPTCEGIADGGWRNQVADALYAARTREECRSALAAADAWVDAHPWDHDMASLMEQPALILEALDLEGRDAPSGTPDPDHHS